MSTPLLDETIRRNRAAQDCWDSFGPHRDRVMQLLLQSQSRDRRLCVLGAGNCNDLDLQLLTAAFGEVHLVDIDREALETAAVRQHVAPHAAIFRHGGVDVTGVAELLEQCAGEDSPDESLLQAIQSRIDASPPVQLPAPFEVVASVCLLTQLIDALQRAVSQQHPKLFDLLLGLRRQHLRWMLDLLRSGGTGVLVTDFVSSDTVPDLGTIDPNHLPDVAMQLIQQRNFFSGVNPFAVHAMLTTDPELASRVRTATLHRPWLWHLKQRVYAVCGLVIQV